MNIPFQNSSDRIRTTRNAVAITKGTKRTLDTRGMTRARSTRRTRHRSGSPRTRWAKCTARSSRSSATTSSRSSRANPLHLHVDIIGGWLPVLVFLIDGGRFELAGWRLGFSSLRGSSVTIVFLSWWHTEWDGSSLKAGDLLQCSVRHFRCQASVYGTSGSAILVSCAF